MVDFPWRFVSLQECKQAKEAVVLVKRSKSNCAMVSKSPGTGSKSNRDNSQPVSQRSVSPHNDAFFSPMLFSENHHFQLEIHLHLWFSRGNLTCLTNKNQTKRCFTPNLKILLPLVGTTGGHFGIAKTCRGAGSRNICHSMGQIGTCNSST